MSALGYVSCQKEGMSRSTMAETHPRQLNSPGLELLVESLPGLRCSILHQQASLGTGGVKLPRIDDGNKLIGTLHNRSI